MHSPPTATVLIRDHDTDRGPSRPPERATVILDPTVKRDDVIYVRLRYDEGPRAGACDWIPRDLVAAGEIDTADILGSLLMTRPTDDEPIAFDLPGVAA